MISGTVFPSTVVVMAGEAAILGSGYANGGWPGAG